MANSAPSHDDEALDLGGAGGPPPIVIMPAHSILFALRTTARYLVIAADALEERMREQGVDPALDLLARAVGEALVEAMRGALKR